MFHNSLELEQKSSLLIKGQLLAGLTLRVVSHRMDEGEKKWITLCASSSFLSFSWHGLLLDESSSSMSLLYGLKEVFSGCLFSLPNLFCFRVALSAHLVRNIDFSLSLFSCLRSERMTERGFRMPEMFTLMPFLPALARPSFNASSSSSSPSPDFFDFVYFLELCDSLG